MSEVKKPKYIQTELGREKLCKHCDEYWPVDSEFWFMAKKQLKDGTISIKPDSACKGCYDAVYRPTKVKNKYKVRSTHEVAA